MKPIKVILLCAISLTIGAMLIFTGASLAQNEDQIPGYASELKKAENGSPKNGDIFGHLQTRDRIITISKGRKGTVYTVKSRDGKVLNANLSEKDFRAKYPSLYEKVKYGLAGNDATLRKTYAEPLVPPRVESVPHK